MGAFVVPFRFQVPRRLIITLGDLHCEIEWYLFFLAGSIYGGFQFFSSPIIVSVYEVI